MRRRKKNESLHGSKVEKELPMSAASTLRHSRLTTINNHVMQRSHEKQLHDEALT